MGAIVFLFLGLALPAVQVAREKARRLHCANNLLQIGLALTNYHDAHAQFPPAYLPDPQGKPRSSWRVAILPFISTSPFYDLYSFGEPWNSERNLALSQRNEGYFYHCSDDYPLDATANYLCAKGTASAWPAPAATSLQDFFSPSHSILLVESVSTGIHWLEPRDFEMDQIDWTIHAPSWLKSLSRSSFSRHAISSGHPTGANVLFADGSLEFLSTETAPEQLHDMLVIAGGADNIPFGPRHRLRLVRDLDSTASQDSPKVYSFKLEAYTTEVGDDSRP